MFTYTFHCDDDHFICNYLDYSDIIYICRHYSNDSSLILRNHYHVITQQDIKCQYDEIFTYKQFIDLIDAKRLVSYCENGHCEYNVIYKNSIIFNTIVRNNHNIDDLINEIVYNSENQIIKSHSYYLKKYGKVYLFNFKKLREMFDYSSTFYDWTDTRSTPSNAVK